MPDQLLMGSLQLYTEPSSSQTSLSVSRTDIGSTSALAQISMFGSGTNNLQGVLTMSTLNSAGQLTEKLRIHTNGFLGIGTNAPSQMLEVAGTVKAAAFLGDGSALSGVSDSSKLPKAGGTMTGALNLPQNGLAAGTNQLVLANGNVGIGTPGPGAKLDVNGTANIIGPVDFLSGSLRLDHSWNPSPTFNGTTFTTVATIRTFDENSHKSISIHNNSGYQTALVTDGPIMSLENGAYFAGNVGIGTPGPGAKLDVNGTANIIGPVDFLSGSLRLDHSWNPSPTFNGTTFTTVATIRTFDENSHKSISIHNNSGYQTALVTDGPIMSLENGAYFAGNVGIGTVTPDAKLEVVGGDIHMEAGRTLYSHGRMHIYGEELLYLLNKSGVVIGKEWGGNGNLQVEGTIGTNGFSPNPLKAGWGGGIHTWDVEAEGTMWSRHGYQSGPRDLAENYLSEIKLEPGDVVCLDENKDLIIRTENAEDTMVLGIISTKPGFLLNVDYVENGELFPVALCGRVPCKVTDENGPITRGDLLTSSSTPGHAMKAKPIEINGMKLYKPGTIVGKALDPLKTGKGLIDVFVFSS